MPTKIAGVSVEVEGPAPRRREALVDFFVKHSPRALANPGSRLLDGLQPGAAYHGFTSDLLDLYRRDVLPEDEADLSCVLALYDGQPRLPEPREVHDWVDELAAHEVVQSFHDLGPQAREVRHEILMLFELKAGTPAARDRADYMDRLTGRDTEDSFNPFMGEARRPPPLREWVWLWYSPAATDCAMGRFTSTDTPQQVVASLKSTMVARTAIQGGLAIPVEESIVRAWAHY